MIGHNELLKKLALFMKMYLPDQTVQVLKFAQLNSRDLLIKMIKPLRAMGFVTSIEKNYSIYWTVDLSNTQLVKSIMVDRLKEICQNR